MGVYSKEEALAKCTANGNKERRMVLKKPQIKLVGEEKSPVIQKFEERFTEDALVLDYLYEKKAEKSDKNEAPFDTNETGMDSEGGDLDWLNSL
jgi:hypothetical protein